MINDFRLLNVFEMLMNTIFFVRLFHIFYFRILNKEVYITDINEYNLMKNKYQ